MLVRKIDAYPLTSVVEVDVDVTDVVCGGTIVTETDELDELELVVVVEDDDDDGVDRTEVELVVVCRLDVVVGVVVVVEVLLLGVVGVLEVLEVLDSLEVLDELVEAVRVVVLEVLVVLVVVRSTVTAETIAARTIITTITSTRIILPTAVRFPAFEPCLPIERWLSCMMALLDGWYLYDL